MGFYTNDQINILQDALNLACADLGIQPEDLEQRERLAFLIMRNACGVRNDTLELKAYAINHFERSQCPGGSRDIEAGYQTSLIA
ncbi:hypothetical protein HYPDE_34818 [Hyphomicrobium denitrificans 1NES1]|uniref:Uncharacterized protein n=1 Tax=Hyphomicrobium denitrificans 1NES1 TaxID=670307 RepID=N0BET8_9HYPH|nr:hypothetical protein [Hyphomicrobium denitrificans]AGK58635.1 hypothetical protein HYPDE_34818 [Hyphomicrobium denitrificans 1NES1]